MARPDRSDTWTWRRRATFVLVAALVAAIAVGSVYLGRHHGDGATAGPGTPAPGTTAPGTTAPATTASATTAPATTAPATTAPGTTAPATAATTSRAQPPTRPPVLTKGGQWWGVDSYVPISAKSLANVRHWYVGGHRPQFWGRYLSGRAGVDKGELEFARDHGIYVYLIVNDRNCSGCAGGDSCGNDRTRAQARADARSALAAARRLGIASGAVLFKDLEEVSSCRGEPTPDYLLTWRATLTGTAYLAGFYGNATRQDFEFPTAYCAAAKRSPQFRADVPMVMNEPEPQLGAPRKTIGPANAPRFRPSFPTCAPPAKVVIWQYGESIDDANATDVDQARPGTRGLLAPDGSVT